MKLRVVKFIIQPVIIGDTGDSLRELPTPPIEVPYEDISLFPVRFAMDLQVKQDEIDLMELRREHMEKEPAELDEEVDVKDFCVDEENLEQEVGVNNG